MREIKFRAWDKKRKIICDDVNVLCSSQNTSDWISNVGGGFYVSPKSKHYILMQYTGLKDKNGVEIYEGDIVKEFGHQSNYRIVKYFRDRFILEYPSGVESETTLLNGIEVIGNIYENKDLLK